MTLRQPVYYNLHARHHRRGILELHSWLLFVLLLLGAVLFSSCARQQTSSRAALTIDELEETRSALRSTVQQMASFFKTTVEDAATEIERKSDRREHRRAALLWRDTMIPASRDAAFQDIPGEALLDLWTLSQRMLDYFSTGEGRILFGEHQQIALEASQRIHNVITQTIPPEVPPKTYEEIEKRITEFARKHPVGPNFTNVRGLSFSEQQEGKTSLQRLVEIPLAPVSILQGVGRTATPIRGISDSFDRFTDVVEELPASTRWQLQLLAMNLEESPLISQTVASMQQITESADRISTMIEQLPQNIRQEAELLLDRVEAAQPEWRATLAETQKTVELVSSASKDLQETASEFERTVSSIQEASVALEQAADAVTLTAREILKFVPADKKDETGQIIGRPPSAEAGTSPDEAGSAQKKDALNLQAVTESAQALSETTEKLSILVADLRELADSKSLSTEAGAVSQQVDGTVDATVGKMKGLVNHIAIRAIQLLILVFILAIAYRVVTARLIGTKKREHEAKKA